MSGINISIKFSLFCASRTDISQRLGAFGAELAQRLGAEIAQRPGAFGRGGGGPGGSACGGRGGELAQRLGAFPSQRHDGNCEGQMQCHKFFTY